METVQRLVRSLKSARSYNLPDDPKAAYYMLLTSVMQNQHRTFIDLLGTSSTFDVNFSLIKSKRTLLHMAANVGAYECLVHLLKKGAKPNVSDRQGITPLQVAARNGYVRCIVKLLEHGADIEKKNNEGMTAVHWLSANGRAEVISEITHYILNIDIEDDNYQTPLHVACMNGHLSAVVKLLDLKADLEKQSAHGYTALYFASAHGHAEVVKELINRRAQFVSNHDHETPLTAALKGGHGRVCFLLITSFPNLLPKLLQSCFSYDIEMNQIKDVLAYIVAQDISYRNLILIYLANTLHAEGLNLLSPSSDYQETCALFLKTVKLLSLVLTCDPHDRKLASEIRPRTPSNLFVRNLSTSASSYEDYKTEPSNLELIEFRLKCLWKTLESWMDILQTEIAAKESSNSSSSVQESKDIHSFASQLKRTSTFKRQTSKNYITLERLRSTQPAHEINLIATHLSRSESYQNALSSLNDDFERTLSPAHSGEDIFDMPSSSFDFEDLSDNIKSPSQPELTQCCSNDHPTSNAVQNTSSTEDSQIVEITADRLCAVIHGYFLICNTEPVWEKQLGKRGGKLHAFKHFIQKYEDVLQLLVSRKPQLIFEHFNFILDSPVLFQRFLPAIHTQPFADRQKWFYERLYDEKKRVSGVYDEQSVIHVLRDSLLQTSCLELTSKNQDLLKKNVTVRFQGEDGMGAGVTREWLDLLVKEMLNPDFALFTLSTDGSTFQPNSNSSINPDHLNYFQFAGRIMGLSLYHKHLITAYFTRSFYKHILGVPVSYLDVESIDPEYTKNLQWILDNSIDELGLDITFSVETDVFGQTQEIELKPNGSNILVTNENKFEYVNLAADLRMTKAIKPQILAFLQGFYEYVPHCLVSLFNEYELELLMSGVPDINLDDWMENTTYQAGFEVSDQTIKWFWEVVLDMTAEEQIQLLQFVTGTSRVPWGGFSNLAGVSGNQLFTICQKEGRLLPTASTCFNMLKLPAYSTKVELEKKLKIAISCGSLGFEFA